MNKAAVLASISFFLLALPSQASFQSGIGVEMAVGYPQMTATLANTNARYQGMSVQGNLILPLLDYEKSFSTDLTLGYRYTSYQNTASSTALAEWAQLQGFAPGVRFNLKYFFLGTEISFLNGRHLVSGSNSGITDYQITPVQAYVGFNFPLGKITSLAASYSQHLIKGRDATIDGDITVSEQLFMLTLQVDLGVGFFNVIKQDSYFEFRDDYSIE